MKEKMTYGQIYSDEFLEKFGEYREAVEKANLDKEFEVDVKKIAELCNIEVTEDDLDVVEEQDEMGACQMMHAVPKTNYIDYDTDIELRKVTINKNRLEKVKRFYLAHEIGHIMIGNLKISENTKINDIKKDIIERINEFNSTYFANELLMPKELLKKALEKIMLEYMYSPKQKFSENDVKLLVVNTSNLMNIPQEILKRRIDNLNLFD